MTVGMNSPFLLLLSPNLETMKATRKRERQGPLSILGDGMIKHDVRWDDQGLIAQSIDCVPVDFLEGQPAEKMSFMAVASAAANESPTPHPGPESLEGSSGLGLKAWDTDLLSTD